MNDLISRAAAIAEIEEYLHGLDSCISEDKLKLDGYRNGLQVAIQEINNAPAVNAAPVVRGRWLERHMVHDAHLIDEWQSALCSRCGKYHTTPYLYYFENYNYCPNCGAKMEGESS